MTTNAMTEITEILKSLSNTQKTLLEMIVSLNERLTELENGK